MNSDPASIPILRYIGIDIHKHYLVSNSRKKRGKEVDGRFREDYDVGETTGKQNTGQTG